MLAERVLFANGRIAVSPSQNISGPGPIVHVASVFCEAKWW